MTFLARTQGLLQPRLLATLVAGTYTNITTYVGYDSGLAGSLSKATLPVAGITGTITLLADVNGSAGLLYISGFSGAPTSSSLSKLVVTGGVNVTRSLAVTPNSVGGGTYSWGVSVIGFVNGNTYTIAIY